MESLGESLSLNVSSVPASPAIPAAATQNNQHNDDD
jgi:hypothetical protein